MTLLEHLAELRDRLFKAVVALVVGSIVGYVLFPHVLDILIQPYCDVPTALRTGSDGSCQLLAIGALEPFTVRIKTAMVIGLFVGGPAIFYQLWRFVTPGLTSRERRYALPFVVFSQLLFAAGIVTAWLIIPQGLRILLDFGGDAIAPALTAGQYLSFYLATSIAFGIVFELPLILIFLSLARIVTARGLRRFRPYALVLNVTIAAIVTPSTDAVTLLFMAVPMVLFYEVAIFAAWLIERRRRKAASS
jgi:sec-independent protein translocase protein TatC